jgi:8-oxo-dGTP diphosphatase
MEFKKQSIKTSVVACIIDENDRVLLTRRCIEPLLEALHREVREEVGIEVHIDGLLDVYEHVAFGDNNDHYVILYYRAHPLTVELQPNNQEVTEADWVPANRLASYNMTPGSRHILAQVYPETLNDPGEPADELTNRNEANNPETETGPGVPCKDEGTR